MKNLQEFLKSYKQIKDFNRICIKLASPKQIRTWSFGEVKKPETISYRFKPEPDGLFCAKIFGPIQDNKCLCAKSPKRQGTVCKKCKVKVTQASVRRERMGHIELASPVAHLWYLKSRPSWMGLMLDLSSEALERIIYFDAYVVVDPGSTTLERGQLLSEETYLDLLEELGEVFEVRIGAEAILELLRTMDLSTEVNRLREEINLSITKVNDKRIRRLKFLESFLQSGNQPEWMVLTVLPVLPPALRPLVPLEGGYFATSDLNVLYQRVINRNNRLKRLVEFDAPDIILHNEKRLLQESVDALFGLRWYSSLGYHKLRLPLKSLSDIIKGKQGRFRQNLLKKRVDYSGRAVVVVEPKLQLHQCGLPKKMALELFKPFVLRELKLRKLAQTIKAAKKLLAYEVKEVWEVLEEVIRDHPVLLNHVPTMHRLGIQAFEPILIEGQAIQLHPLVCKAFNANFDGDQMMVHVPLSIEAQLEARALMMSSNNLLSPANGEPVIVPSQEMVLGLYFMTLEHVEAVGSGMAFANFNEMHLAYDSKVVALNAKITVRIKETAKKITRKKTTVGRALLFEILPSALSFGLINKVLTKNAISQLIKTCYYKVGLKETVIFAHQLMEMGFYYATRAGISLTIADIPNNLSAMLNSGALEQDTLKPNFRDGLTVSQYFRSTSEGRMELVETALKTINSIYLMRRLVDVAQEQVIYEFDCGTENGLEISALIREGQVLSPLSERVLGRGRYFYA